MEPSEHKTGDRVVTAKGTGFVIWSTPDLTKVELDRFLLFPRQSVVFRTEDVFATPGGREEP